MKIAKSLAALLGAIIMTIAVAGCSPTAKTEGTGGYIDDSVITTKVKAALLGEKTIRSTQITVTTFKGKVQLSGFVRSKDESNAAADVAKTVVGVRSVENDLLVK
ncbi:BON domain-containing protein [Budviciaceae bacterium CWB-B4]|uniref:Osmotically-inducible protein Y n=1 Tax=Limnobaculum xujianqingii TaxID=2738837 RepID=A0A9D7FQR7_9GAMM|nr:BON domain-containing protein [Limnobaculum xujianqingii]MBK5071849.1 BON domain-containing protein [Limnobaculum xujianqingii]MBK5175158.1 BON domain-containing protein [Limnobaculum xujianqingii]